MRQPVRNVSMTPAEARAQDATVVILRRHCDEAEAPHLPDPEKFTRGDHSPPKPKT